MKTYLAIAAIFCFIGLAGLPLTAHAQDEGAAATPQQDRIAVPSQDPEPEEPALPEEVVPPMEKFMKDMASCKTSTQQSGAQDKRTFTASYVACMTDRGYSEDDVRARSQGTEFDFSDAPQ